MIIAKVLLCIMLLRKSINNDKVVKAVRNKQSLKFNLFNVLK